MIKTIVICDRCGKQMPMDERIELKAEGEDDAWSYELCKECWNEIKKSIRKGTV